MVRKGENDFREVKGGERGLRRKQLILLNGIERLSKKMIGGYLLNLELWRLSVIFRRVVVMEL